MRKRWNGSLWKRKPRYTRSVREQFMDYAIAHQPAITAGNALLSYLNRKPTTEAERALMAQVRI